MKPCQKISFASKQAAKTEAKRINVCNKHYRCARGSKNNKKIRAYECPICLKWHLTTLKPEKYMKPINRKRLKKVHTDAAN